MDNKIEKKSKMPIEKELVIYKIISIIAILGLLVSLSKIYAMRPTTGVTKPDKTLGRTTTLPAQIVIKVDGKKFTNKKFGKELNDFIDTRTTQFILDKAKDDMIAKKNITLSKQEEEDAIKQLTEDYGYLQMLEENYQNDEKALKEDVIRNAKFNKYIKAVEEDIEITKEMEERIMSGESLAPEVVEKIKETQGLKEYVKERMAYEQVMSELEAIRNSLEVEIIK